MLNNARYVRAVGRAPVWWRSALVWCAPILAIAVASSCATRARPAAPAPAPNSAQRAVPGAFAKHLSFAVLEDYDKGEDLRGVAADFALMRELGIGTWRGSFGWDDYEPARGKYDFAWLEQFAALAERDGITLRPYIGYTPEWAGVKGTDSDAWNNPPANLDDWSAFVRSLVAALRPYRNVRSYEIYNEENVKQWWDGTPAQYYEVLARAAAAVRAANPAAQVVFGGMVWPDAPFAEGACATRQGAAAFDILPFHAYPETWTPDSVTVESYLGAGFQDYFVHAVDSACGRKPIWIDETGFATVPGKTERQQADWWVRAIATFAATPRIDEIGVYEIKDARPDKPVIGDQPNYHLGITHTDRSKKLAFSTIAMMVRLLGRDSIVVDDSALRVDVSAGHAQRLYEHLFRRRDGAQVLVVWDRLGAPALRVTLPARGTRALEYAPNGSSRAYRAFDGITLRDVELTPGRARIFEILP
jgi:hypothetical protein